MRPANTRASIPGFSQRLLQGSLSCKRENTLLALLSPNIRKFCGLRKHEGGFCNATREEWQVALSKNPVPSLKRKPKSDLSPPPHQYALPLLGRFPQLLTRPVSCHSARPAGVREAGSGSPPVTGTAGAQGPQTSAAPASPCRGVAGGPRRPHETRHDGEQTGRARRRTESTPRTRTSGRPPAAGGRGRGARRGAEGRRAAPNSRLYSAISLLSAVPAIFRATAAPSASPPQRSSLPPDARAASGSPRGHRSPSGTQGACAGRAACAAGGVGCGPKPLCGVNAASGDPDSGRELCRRSRSSECLQSVCEPPVPSSWP